ncbi:Gfo/Idh/MocA family oxidoreductase [Pectobacterium polonicum]|uniref:Gfo/Idh/MocA family protein n=1 Tax=Pectobacterium polonicum TaxID=2485124 RepID=UPI00235FD1AD|nr:Gfo/Idh/MocA family oxidoreductase [Pectobacterium polonicum]MDC9817926.1 Gfo/Idh/MocA family oxidoreductase [Pectobacterium polonicum]
MKKIRFAAIGLAHNHIYDMCRQLVDAGAELAGVFESDPDNREKFTSLFPSIPFASSAEQLISDASIDLIACAAIPSDRAELALRALDAGKDFFTAKPPLTSLEQLDAVQRRVAKTGRKFAVYFNERINVDSALFAGELVQRGEIGRVIQTMGVGPHRERGARPDWFYQKRQYGGILCDIGIHQIEQFLYFTGNTDARVVTSQTANYHHPHHPDFEDFGDAVLLGDNGATGYFRCDWFTPDGLSVWGDGRLTILGTEGYIEIRKYVDLTRDESNIVYLVNSKGEQRFTPAGSVNRPFFPDFLHDCRERTETAMSQSHIFKATELSILAQQAAKKIA